MENKKATIKDVASLSKVSIKTVSRVINNEYGVSRTTKSKVLKSIKTLDYNPNKAAQGLRSKKSFLIGLVYDNPDKFYLSDIQTGVLETCAINGFSVVLFPCDHQEVDLTANLIEFSKRTNLDGLILTPPISDMKELVKSLQLEIPLCVVSPGLLTSNPLCVSSDDFEASYSMTCHLINQGHSEIGFIKGHKDHGATQHRLDGYLDALSDNNIEIKQENITEGDFSFDSGEIAAKQLLKKGTFSADCPVSGGCHRAETGNISIFAGCERSVFEQIKPLLFILGKKVLHTGSLGSASTLKVMTNFLATTHLVACCEALTAMKAADIDMGTAYEAIKISSGNTNTTLNKNIGKKNTNNKSTNSNVNITNISKNATPLTSEEKQIKINELINELNNISNGKIDIGEVTKKINEMINEQTINNKNQAMNKVISMLEKKIKISKE